MLLLLIIIILNYAIVAYWYYKFIYFYMESKFLLSHKQYFSYGCYYDNKNNSYEHYQKSKFLNNKELNRDKYQKYK